ncbi:MULTISPECIES: disulfide isomerase DsbC N-terminal domain-containing protein [Halomonas]|uniref:disulfide isomerase DsbC N-terminal domain-containing protein n=1 Tax=Halomonas TaxID=2745 RepID=UPI0018673936|nr:MULTISPECIES: disulfide isomerase DsbC N-terminal domain-containing protein [Halomonas]
MRVTTMTAAALLALTSASTLQANLTDSSPSAFNVREDLNPLIPHLGSLKPHAMTELPIKGLVGIESDGEVLFISDNGRYAFQGRAHDLWYNLPLDNMDAINKSATTLAISEMGIDTRALNALTLGDPDAPMDQVHTVFIDPACGHCLTYVDQVADLALQDMSVSFVIIPAFGESSYAAAEHVACLDDDVDDAQLLEALLDESITSLPRREADDCDMTNYRSTLVLAEQLQVDGVPFTTTAAGEVVRGIPSDISALFRNE